MAGADFWSLYGEATLTSLLKRSTSVPKTWQLLRTTHLAAHLDITPLLSSEQIERYD